MYSHAIFDLDGTLLDTEALYSRATDEVLAPYGARFDVALKRRTMGRDNRRGAEMIIAALELPLSPEDFLAARDRAFRALLPEIRPLPGALELLARAAGRGVELAIATSSHEAIARDKLAQAPVAEHVRVLVFGDDPRIRAGKPDPAIFELAAAELGAPRERCVVFEDSANGVRAGLAAGMAVVAIRDPRWSLPEAAFAGALAVVESPAALDPKVLGW